MLDTTGKNRSIHVLINLVSWQALRACRKSNLRLRLVAVVTVALLALTGCSGGERSKRITDDDDRIELPEVGEADELSAVWSRDLGAGVGDRYLDLVIAVIEDVVFAADPGGTISALSAEDGTVIWTTDLERPISAGVGVSATLVFVADSDGHVYGLDAATGEQRWMVNAGGEVLAVPVVDASTSTVIVRTVSGRVTALRSTDGARRWAYQRTVPALSLRGTAPPAIYDGVALTSFASGKLVANDVESGTILWEYDVVAPSGRNEIDRMIDLDATPLLVGSVVYLAAFQGEVLALALGNRTVLWSKPVSSFRDIAADDDAVYVTADDGEIVALDRLTGEERWTQLALRGYSDTAPSRDQSVRCRR